MLANQSNFQLTDETEHMPKDKLQLVKKNSFWFLWSFVLSQQFIIRACFPAAFVNSVKKTSADSRATRGTLKPGQITKNLNLVSNQNPPEPHLDSAPCLSICRAQKSLFPIFCLEESFNRISICYLESHKICGCYWECLFGHLKLCFHLTLADISKPELWISSEQLFFLSIIQCPHPCPTSGFIRNLETSRNTEGCGVTAALTVK